MKKFYSLCLFIAVMTMALKAQTFTVSSGKITHSNNEVAQELSNSVGRKQIFIPAGDIIASGITTQRIISKLGVDFLTLNSFYANGLSDFTIRLKNTSSTSLSSDWETGIKEVFTIKDYNPEAGWNIFNLNTPFYWDGTSNLLIDIYFKDEKAKAGTQVNFRAFPSQNTGVNTNASVQFFMSSMVPTNLKANSISSPTQILNLNSSNVVTYNFTNLAGAVANSATFNYKWNNLAPVSVTISGVAPFPLAVGASANFSFAVPLVATPAGANVLKVWSSMPNGAADVTPANDTATYLIWVNDPASPPVSLSYSGKDFWLGYLQNGGDDVGLTQTLYITAPNASLVTITAPKAGTPVWSTTIAVPANTVQSVIVPNIINTLDIDLKAPETISNTGIHIVSTTPVTVYGMSFKQYTSDGYLAIPTSALGIDYVIEAPRGLIGGGGVLGSAAALPSNFMIVATEDGTNVTITTKGRTQKPAATVSHAANTPWTVALNQGQSYLVEGYQALVGGGLLGAPTTYNDNMTGSRVTANKPVFVLGGTECANLPITGGTAGMGVCPYCDHVNEVMTPTQSWGKTFYITDFVDKTSADYVNIITYFTGTTTFSINGTSYTLTGQGAFGEYPLPLTGGSVITSNQPIYVVQQMTGADCDVPRTPTDPSIVNVLPAEQWGNYYGFLSPTAGFISNYINVIKKSSAARIALDGQMISAGWTQIGTTGYYATQMTVAVGPHVLFGDSICMVYVYGNNADESYAYPASGAQLKIINPLAPLPMEMLSFTGRMYNEDQALLEWITATEVNNDHFDVERSSDAVSFSTIGQLKAAGNSTESKYYNFTDDNMPDGTSYYRITQIDHDGKFSNSEVIALTKKLKGVFALNYVRPLPANDNVFISFNTSDEDKTQITIYDVTGRKVLDKVITQISVGNNEVELDISSLKAGTYTIIIQQNEKRVPSKLVKY